MDNQNMILVALRGDRGEARLLHQLHLVDLVHRELLPVLDLVQQRLVGLPGNRTWEGVIGTPAPKTCGHIVPEKKNL